jgi:hypothetical protein
VGELQTFFISFNFELFFILFVSCLQKEGTTLLLADIFSTCFGWEPIKPIKETVLQPVNGSRIDPKFVNNPELSDVTFRWESCLDFCSPSRSDFISLRFVFFVPFQLRYGQSREQNILWTQNRPRDCFATSPEFAELQSEWRKWNADCANQRHSISYLWGEALLKPERRSNLISSSNTCTEW